MRAEIWRVFLWFSPCKIFLVFPAIIVIWFFIFKIWNIDWKGKIADIAFNAKWLIFVKEGTDWHSPARTFTLKRTVESNTCWPEVTLRPSTIPGRGDLTTCYIKIKYRQIDVIPNITRTKRWNLNKIWEYLHFHCFKYQNGLSLFNLNTIFN